MNGSIIIHVDNLEWIYIIKMYIYIYTHIIYIYTITIIYIYVHYVYQVDHPSNVTILPFATSNLSLSWIAGTFPTILNNTYSTKEPCKFHAICIDLLVSANSFQRLILCSTKIRWSHKKLSSAFEFAAAPREFGSSFGVLSGGRTPRRFS